MRQRDLVLQRGLRARIRLTKSNGALKPLEDLAVSYVPPLTSCGCIVVLPSQTSGMAAESKKPTTAHRLLHQAHHISQPARPRHPAPSFHREAVSRTFRHSLPARACCETFSCASRLVRIATVQRADPGRSRPRASEKQRAAGCGKIAVMGRGCASHWRWEASWQGETARGRRFRPAGEL